MTFVICHQFYDDFDPNFSFLYPERMFQGFSGSEDFNPLKH